MRGVTCHTFEFVEQIKNTKTLGPAASYVGKPKDGLKSIDVPESHFSIRASLSYLAVVMIYYGLLWFCPAVMKTLWKLKTASLKVILVCTMRLIAFESCCSGEQSC